MALVNGDIIQAGLHSSVFGQRIILGSRWRYAGMGVPGQTIQEALDEVGKLLFSNGLNDILDKLLLILPPNVNVDFWRTQVVRPNRSVLFEKLLAVPGTWATACTTANLAATITQRTDYAGRSQVSTLHVGPVAPDQYADGSLTNAYRLLLDDLGNALGQAVDGAATIGGILRPVIMHPGGTTDFIESHVVGTTLRTYRKRNVGVGI